MREISEISVQSLGETFELADAMARKLGANTVYPLDIDKRGSGNNILYITVPGVESYDDMDGKSVALNTGIYCVQWDEPQTVYININGLGNKALYRPLPTNASADYDDRQYNTTKYVKGEISRQQTLIVSFRKDGSVVTATLLNPAPAPRATKEIAEDSSDDVSYVTPKAVAAALKDKAPLNHASNLSDYGLGDGYRYGHVSLTDSVDEMNDSDVENGVATTPKAVFDAIQGTWANPFVVSDSGTDLSTLTTPGVYHFDFEEKVYVVTIEDYGDFGCYTNGYMEVVSLWDDVSSKATVGQTLYVCDEGGFYSCTRSVASGIGGKWRVSAWVADITNPNLEDRIKHLEKVIKSLTGGGEYETRITALESKIDAEIERSKGVESSLNAAFNAELIKRAGEDDKLQSQIDELKAAIGN